MLLLCTTHTQQLPIIDYCVHHAIQDGKCIVCRHSAAFTHNKSLLINHCMCCAVQDGKCVVCRHSAASTHNKSLIINHCAPCAVQDSKHHITPLLSDKLCYFFNRPYNMLISCFLNSISILSSIAQCSTLVSTPNLTNTRQDPLSLQHWQNGTNKTIKLDVLTQVIQHHLTSDGKQLVKMQNNGKTLEPNLEYSTDRVEYPECDCIVVHLAFPSSNGVIHDVGLSICSTT